MNRPERAKREDAAEILALYRAAAKAANQSGYSHWDEDYPNRETIRDDLENGYLYVWREDGEIVAAITYMHPYDLDGLGISWTPVERAVEACRFCLSPSQQGKGRAKAYFLGGMELLRAQGVEAMRYLCACDNIAAYGIYTGLGHRQLEDTKLHGVAFHSFEALLQSGTARTDGEDADEDLAGGAEDADEDFADGAEDADANDAPRRPTARQLRAAGREALRGKWLRMALICLVLALLYNARLGVDDMTVKTRASDDAPVAVDATLPEEYDDGLISAADGPQTEYCIDLSADLGPLTRAHTSVWARQSALISHVPSGPAASHLLAAWTGFFRAEPAFWLAGLALTLVSVLFIPALQLGQYETLHAAFSGEKPTLRQLFSRLRQWPRALWLSVCIAFLTGEWLVALWPLLVSLQNLGLLSGGVMLALSVATLALIFYYAVALLRYAMAPYLLWKEPRLRVRETLRLSRERMWGNKAAYFRLSLSYIGWYLLEAVAIGGFAAFLGNCAVAPSLQTAIYGFLTYTCTAFLSSYVSAGGFAFFRDLETRQAFKD